MIVRFYVAHHAFLENREESMAVEELAKANYRKEAADIYRRRRVCQAYDASFPPSITTVCS